MSIFLYRLNFFFLSYLAITLRFLHQKMLYRPCYVFVCVESELIPRVESVATTSVVPRWEIIILKTSTRRRYLSRLFGDEAIRSCWNALPSTSPIRTHHIIHTVHQVHQRHFLFIEVPTSTLLWTIYRFCYAFQSQIPAFPLFFSCRRWWAISMFTSTRPWGMSTPRFIWNRAARRQNNNLDVEKFKERRLQHFRLPRSLTTVVSNTIKIRLLYDECACFSFLCVCVSTRLQLSQVLWSDNLSPLLPQRFVSFTFA